MTTSGKSHFPTTDWGLFADVRGKNTRIKRVALDILTQRYWRPVYAFLRRNGRDVESAKDSTQAFFAAWIEDDVFSKADPGKGRFRSYMLSCLKRFVANEHRAGQALKRRPKDGLASLDEMMADAEISYEPKDQGLTPEQVFDRSWATEIVRRVLRHLMVECERTGKQTHYEIFRQRIIEPILDGVNAPELTELGNVYGLTQKQTANNLETAKRAYRRLLEEEIRLYSASEGDVCDEVREIFLILGR